MLKPLSFAGALLIVSTAIAQTPQDPQTQNPPTASRTQSPAQDSSQRQPMAQQEPRSGSQQTGQRSQDESGRRTANFRGPTDAQQSGSASRTDSHLANCLIQGNEAEVTLARLAQDQASNPKVKEFAQQMIKDHTKGASDLKQFASAQGQGSEIEQKMAQIGREKGQECLKLAQEELRQHRGREFDECFIGQQIGGHIQMVAELRTYEKHASPELQKVLREQLQTAEQHLDHARQLARDVKQGGTESASTSQTRTER